MINDLLPVIIEASLFALAAGLVYGVFGGGSGLFLTPSYYFLSRHFPIAHGYEMQIAIATTCITTVFLGIAPTVMQWRQKHVDWQTIKHILCGLLVGSIAAVILLNYIPSTFLKHLFGVVVILVAIWFWFYRQENDKKIWPLKSVQNVLMTTGIGLLWFLLGVAVFNVPYMHKCGVSMRKAVGSGTFVGIIFSLLVGLLLMTTGSFKIGDSLHQVGYLNTTLLLISVLPSMIGAIIGAKISLKLPQRHLKKIYAMLIFVIGGLMLI